MKNSEVKIVFVAAVCDRRRVKSKHPAGCRIGCRISEQKQTKETKSQSRFRFSTSFSLFASVQNQAQSSPIKPNQAISSRYTIQSRPPSCSKIPTSSVLLRQTRSKPVKVLFNSHRQGKNAAGLAIYCGLPRTIYNRWWFAFAADTAIRGQSAICNPQSAIPLDSTWFHLIPLNSTSAIPAAHAQEHHENQKTPASCANSRPGNGPS